MSWISGNLKWNFDFSTDREFFQRTCKFLFFRMTYVNILIVVQIDVFFRQSRNSKSLISITQLVGVPVCHTSWHSSKSHHCFEKWMGKTGSATMLATNSSTGITPGVNLRNPLYPGKEVRNWRDPPFNFISKADITRGISGILSSSNFFFKIFNPRVKTKELKYVIEYTFKSNNYFLIYADKVMLWLFTVHQKLRNIDP